MNTTTEVQSGQDVYTIVTNRIIELLEAGTVPWLRPWSQAGLPHNLITKKPYRGINVWLLSSLNYSNNSFLTFKQVKDLGGSIKRGEKSHLVIFWKWIKTIPDQLDENVKDTKKKVLLRYYKVFNIEQCTDIPPSKIPVTENRLTEPIGACEDIIEDMPSPPRIYHEAPEAFYNVKDDSINMPLRKLFVSSEAYYATLFHEIIHSTGHQTRLNRKGIAEHEPFGSKVYSFEELVAEMGACYLTSHAGIDNLPVENSAAYIQSWLTSFKNDRKLLVYAGSYAQRATDYILGVKQSTDEESEYHHVSHSLI